MLQPAASDRSDADQIASSTCYSQRARGFQLLSDAETTLAFRGGVHGAIDVVGLPERVRLQSRAGEERAPLAAHADQRAGRGHEQLQEAICK